MLFMTYIMLEDRSKTHITTSEYTAYGTLRFVHSYE